jgi:AcrR family transcriptional regulator
VDYPKTVSEDLTRSQQRRYTYNLTVCIMKRTREEAEQTREAIFQAGIAVLARKGIDATSMADIARAAGVSRGAIYWHFENKGALLREIHGRLHAFYKSIVDDVVKDPASPLDSIGRAVKKLFGRYQNDDSFRRLQDLQLMISVLYAGKRAVADHIIETEQVACERFRQSINGSPLLEVHEPSHLFLIVESFVGGLLFCQYIRQRAMSDGEISAAAAFLVRGLSDLTIGTQNQTCSGAQQ